MAKESIELVNIRKIEENKNGDVKASSAKFGVRHTQVIINFFLTFIAYCIRVTISVAIVAMTTKTSKNPDIPVYEWDDKSIILSSFFWGYMAPQIAAGLLAKKYGSKWILIAAMSACSVLCILLPPMAKHFGSEGVIVSRIMQGFCQGFVYPCIHHLLGQWVPIVERSRLGTFVYAGALLGTVVSMIVSGIIAASSFGWPWIFYVNGILGFVWCVAMAIVGSNKPEDSKIISEEEKRFIVEGLDRNPDAKHLPTPWLDILSSRPFWALLITHCGQNWGFWTLITEIPSYMSDVMNFQIKSNSYLSALPYFVFWLLSFVFSYAADYLIVKQYATIGTTRKILNSIGLLIPAIALVFLGFTRSDQHLLAIVLLVFAVSVNSATLAGFNLNHIDIAPNHAGTLMGMTNCVANICSFLAPLFVQVVVTDGTDTTQWRKVFCVAATAYFVTDFVFVLWGSGEVQEWNDKGCKEIKQQDKNSEKQENKASERKEDDSGKNKCSTSSYENVLHDQMS